MPVDMPGVAPGLRPFSPGVLGMLMRSSSADLMGGCRACRRATARVYATGESQSAFRLSRYFNALQPTWGLYDGFLLYDRGGPHALRDDFPAKLIGMGSEFFAESMPTGPEDAEHGLKIAVASANRRQSTEEAN